ncbi:MAG TPA: aldo/keto reductase [Aquabacterium sp.]|nr:aldo/keto reductase [Aquabacterium sp.]HQC94748.1 aldo/keto reductase [Aquabacterium sp.]
MEQPADATFRINARPPLFAGQPDAPQFVFGCEQLGGHNWGELDIDAVREAIGVAVDRGVALFDTADCYGPYLSEERLGQALAGLGERVHIATKFGVRLDDQGRRRNDSSAAWCRQAVRASLRRLGVERIALYQLHCHDGHTPIEETLQALADLKSEGLIAASGVCNLGAQALTPAQWRACATLQAELSLLAPHQVATVREVCDQGVQFLAYGVLAQGLLSGRYGADTRFAANDRRAMPRYHNFHGQRLQAALALVDTLRREADGFGCSPGMLAIAWARAVHPNVWPIVGIKRRSHVDDAVRALSLQVPPGVIASLSAAARDFGAST